MKFNDCFKTTPNTDYSDGKSVFTNPIPVMVDDGIFQFHSRDNKYGPYVDQLFSRNGSIVFGSDWIGRLFFVTDADGKVKIADGGFKEVLDVPCSIQEFLNIEMTQYKDDLLLAPFYSKYVKKYNIVPAINQCIGYKKFPRLGGKDDVDNLEPCDLDVYWHLLSQL